jgi:gliding motility-associated-like protein
MLPITKNSFIYCILILLLSIAENDGFGQRTANHWFFNNYIGIDFNSGEPVPEHLGQIGYYNGGPGCMSDTNGNLLFYTDGDKIWNRLHQVMLNGEDILGARSASQSAIIFPVPGSQSKYYVFTVGGPYEHWGLRYNIIDMNLDGGLGAVIAKNIALTAATWAENKLTAVRHANGKDYWVVTRIFNDDKFAPFLVSATGVNPTPVLSNTRYIPNTCSTLYPMKISPDGKKLFCPIASYPLVDGHADVEICDFDTETGFVDFKYTLLDDVFPGSSGRIEFSPDSKLLYRVSDSISLPPAPQFDLGLLFQYDMSQIDDSLGFLQSRQIVARGSFGSGIQLAPDGKIYMQSNCAWNGTPNYCMSADSLSVINKPWIRGAGCAVQQSVFYLQYGHTNLGEFPNFMQEQLYRFVWSGGLCAGVPFNFRHRFIPEPDSIHWDFGDPGSGAANTSTLHNPTHVFSAGGTYEVYTYVKYPNGRIEETSREVEVLPKPYPNLGPDTLVCAGTDVTLTPGSGYAGYYWNGSIMPGNPTYLASDTGTYIVRVKNDLGCYNADTIQVLQRPAPALDETNLNLAPTTCGGTTGAITGLQINGQPPYSFQWTASGTPISDLLDIYHLGTGLYELHVTDGFGCTNIVASYAISDAGNILIDTATVTPAYCGNNDGTLTINAVSGLGSMLQYFIKTGSDTLSQWSNGNFTGLAGGNYYVWVTDSSGCSSVYASVLQIEALTAPEILTATSTPETGSAADGTITVNALGIGLTYSLNGATPVNTGHFTGLSAGSYSVTVTNPAGCDTTLTITVEHETGIVLSAIAGNGFACLGKEAKAPIVVRNFKDVQSFETILNYDKLFVNCIGYSNPHPQLADSLEVTLFPVSGKIQTRWKGTTPLTLPDSTEIVQLVFSSLLPGNALLLWDISPAISNFFGPGGDTLNVDYTLGTILVSNPPQILPDPKQTDCEGGLLMVWRTVVNGTGPLSYQWQTPAGPSSQEIIIKTATLADNGLYSLIVTDTLQCADTSTKIVTVVPTPVSGFPTNSDTLYFDERRWLEAAQGYDTYSWNTGDTTNSILVTAEGWYKVTISTPEGCTTTDSVMMLYAFVPLTMPNAFTPDGDLLNDVFRPVTLPEKITSFSMYIYDRWGKQVFFTNDVTQGWDGTINGSPAQIGGYVYVVKYGNPSGAEREKRGMVMVVR